MDSIVTSVIIALGSNAQQAAHIQWASQRLTRMLVGARLSRTRWTPDVRRTGKMYMNRLIAGETALPPTALTAALKAMEASTGRTRDAVTIDLDLMQYGDDRYHERDWSRPYIQQLISDVI